MACSETLFANADECKNESIADKAIRLFRDELLQAEAKMTQARAPATLGSFSQELATMTSDAIFGSRMVRLT